LNPLIDGEKDFWIIDWFLIVDLAYLIPPFLKAQYNW
jgi:hypothetical protein